MLADVPHRGGRPIDRSGVHHWTGVIGVTLIATTGCGREAPGPVRDRAPIATDSVVYHLTARDGAYTATARVRYVNRTGAPAIFTRCGAPGWQGLRRWRRRTGPDSTRALFTDDVWACPAGEPDVVLAPGASVTVQVRLGAFPQQDVQPPLRLEQITGRMRVEFEICRTPTDLFHGCVRVPQAERQSNAFDVRL